MESMGILYPPSLPPSGVRVIAKGVPQRGKERVIAKGVRTSVGGKQRGKERVIAKGVRTSVGDKQRGEEMVITEGDRVRTQSTKSSKKI